MIRLLAFAVISVLAARAGAADSIFRAGTALPVELQERVRLAISQECPAAIPGLQEVETSVTEIRADQITDYAYRTRLTSPSVLDGTGSVGIDVIVESAEYSISNPAIDRFEIKSVKVSLPDVCWPR